MGRDDATRPRSTGHGRNRVKRAKPAHARVRKPMPRKPPKVEVPKTAYRRRPKHPGRDAEGGT